MAQTWKVWICAHIVVSFQMVSQDTILFDGSVRENITYGLKSFSEAVVETALRDANALEFVEHLPQGWKPISGKKAPGFGGQKQRLANCPGVDPRPARAHPG